MASEPDTPFCGEVVPPAHPPSDTRGGSALNISMLGYDAMRVRCGSSTFPPALCGYGKGRLTEVRKVALCAPQHDPPTQS